MVGQQLQFKWKSYHSLEDFERGRRKMLADDWVVVEERTTQGKAPYDLGGSLLGLIFLPIVWLFNKTQPEAILHVRYVRRR